MQAKDVIRYNLDVSTQVLKAYLEDLSDSDLLRRPGVGCNHLAWQLGHVVAAGCRLLESVVPGAAPPLPAGFAEKHTPETSGENDAAKFYSKRQYLELMDTVNAAVLSALEKLSPSDLDKPSPEHLRPHFPTVGTVFALIASHGLMHSGQFVPVRRALGKPVKI